MFTGLSLNATRDQLDAAQQQNALTEQGQVTDRYGKAVEQVGRQGVEYLQVRLGGIYALERLARDSTRDQPTIIEVLSAFVRTSTQIAPGEPCPKEPPNADVQAALTVLGRRNIDQDRGTRVDLRGACLAPAELAEARFDHASLSRTYLNGASLINIDLNGASLDDADLSESDLAGANLNDAWLFSADLTGADLSEADFTDATLNQAQLRNADLRAAQLDNTYLHNAHLNGAYLGRASLNGARLLGADLTGAEHDEYTQTDGAKTDESTLGKWW